MSATISLWTTLFGNREMTSCHKALRLLQQALDGELDDRTMKRVSRHFEACRKCGLEAATYQAIKDAIKSRTHLAIDPAAIADLEHFARGLGQSPGH